MTAPSWGRVPYVLRRIKARPPGFPTAPLDQKQAALRDWLDDHDVSVRDPDQLRLILLGMELLTEEVAQSAEHGIYPKIWATSLVAHVSGLTATLAPYVPAEVWPDDRL